MKNQELTIDNQCVNCLKELGENEGRVIDGSRQRDWKYPALFFGYRVCGEPCERELEEIASGFNYLHTRFAGSSCDMLEPVRDFIRYNRPDENFARLLLGLLSQVVVSFNETVTDENTLDDLARDLIGIFYAISERVPDLQELNRYRGYFINVFEGMKPETVPETSEPEPDPDKLNKTACDFLDRLLYNLRPSGKIDYDHVVNDSHINFVRSFISFAGGSVNENLLNEFISKCDNFQDGIDSETEGVKK